MEKLEFEWRCGNKSSRSDSNYPIETVFFVFFEKAWTWSNFFEDIRFRITFSWKIRFWIKNLQIVRFGIVFFRLVRFGNSFLQSVTFRTESFLSGEILNYNLFIFSFVEFNYRSTACNSHNVFLFTKMYTYCLQRLCQLNYSNRRTKKFLYSLWRKLCLRNSIWFHTFFIWTSYMQKLAVTIRMTDSGTWTVSVSEMSD